MKSDAELLVPCKVNPFESTIAMKFVRKIDNGRDKDNLFARFAILPNVHGQKYTVGATYTSREEQGEFILLPSEVQNKGSFAINVENDKYFLVPGPRTTSIFVNGSQVLVKETRELTFGDKFWVGNEMDAFLFVKRELNERAVIGARVKSRNTEMDFNYNRSGRPRFTKAKADFIPGQNGLIVSQIVSYLPVGDLKNCRFLSKLWNEEAKKILGKRCTLFLNFSSNYQHPDESMKLLRYSLEMVDLPLQNLRIEVPILNGNPDAEARMSVSQMMDLKLVDDLSWFWDSRNARNINKLEMDGDINYQLGLKILTALSSTLKELNLAWNNGWKSPPRPFPPNLKFHKLTTFHLSGWDTGDTSPTLGLLDGLFPAINGVSSIQLKNCEAELCSTVLSKMPTTSFPNLNKFSSFLVTPDAIQCLFKDHKAMKTLELGELKDMKPGDILAFEELLKKHAATLESLEFVICPMIVQNPAGQVIEIKLPSLPKLRHLSIGLSHEFAKVSPPGLMLNFPGGGINYEEDFPTLRSLTLWPLRCDNKKNYILSGSTMTRVRDQIESFYAMFFPTIDPDFVGEPQIVRSVLELDILTHASTQEYERASLLSEIAVTRIKEMFPDSDWAKEGQGRKLYSFENFTSWDSDDWSSDDWSSEDWDSDDSGWGNFGWGSGSDDWESDWDSDEGNQD